MESLVLLGALVVFSVACSREQRAPDALAMADQNSTAPQAREATYILAGSPDNLAVGAPRRFVVSIRVPFGYSRDEVSTMLEKVVREQQRVLAAQAVSVHAYRPDDRIGAGYTVGAATMAPYGDWSRARESGPMQVKVELVDAYFDGDPQLAAGATKRLIADGAMNTVDVSRRFESWGDADLVARVAAGLTAEILETRTYGPYVTRYRIVVTHRGKRIEGWVHDSDVE